jgi:ribosomal protein S18 acetylase RimI-like enzyme
MLATTSFRPAEEHLVSLGQMLGRAFFSDPLFDYIYPDLEERKNYIAYGHEFVCRYGHRFGEVWAMSDLSACSIWLPPGATDFTPEREAQIVMPSSTIPDTKQGKARANNFYAMIDKAQRRLLPDPHWYLVMIGVEPERQGQGIGSALIAPMLDRIDQSQLPCYLETVNQKTFPFYKRHGFAIVDEDDIPGTSTRVWFLIRNPQFMK